MTAVPARPSVTASGTPASVSAMKTPKRIRSTAASSDRARVRMRISKRTTINTDSTGSHTV